MAVTIRLPTPPSTNALYANVPGRGRVPSIKYCEWKKEALASLWGQRYAPVHGPVSLHIVVKENGRRDLGNYEKATTDFLVSNGIIDGDRCKIVRAITLVWGDVDGAEITIEEWK